MTSQKWQNRHMQSYVNTQHFHNAFLHIEVVWVKLVFVPSEPYRQPPWGERGASLLRPSNAILCRVGRNAPVQIMLENLKFSGFHPLWDRCSNTSMNCLSFLFLYSINCTTSFANVKCYSSYLSYRGIWFYIIWRSNDLSQPLWKR